MNRIEKWRQEKTGIGPEPEMITSANNETADATIYADDNSAGEVGATVDELKFKTEYMLEKIFQHMRTNRLLIHAGKTKVMLFATSQKRSKNDLSFHLDVENLKLEEVESATLLGVVLSNNFSWDEHVGEVIEKCSKRLNGLYKVQRQLDITQRKTLAECSFLSRLKYAIEVSEEVGRH